MTGFSPARRNLAVARAFFLADAILMPAHVLVMPPMNLHVNAWRLANLPKWEIMTLMRVIAKRSLKQFWERPGCGDARGPLHSWYDEAVKATWRSPQDIKDQYASASICVNNRVVFNVGGNKYRLVVEMQYQAGIAWVKFVGTHAQYDRIDVENVNDY